VSPVPHHVVVRLPDGRRAVADWREGIVATMRDIHAQVADAANPDDIQAVTDWLDAHARQSQRCDDALATGASCGHD